MTSYQVMPDLPEELSAREQRVLGICEQAISGGPTFLDQVMALLVIRDNRLYRAQHATFEEYCETRWSVSPLRAEELIDAALTLRELSLMDDVPLPASEQQIRELVALSPDEQRVVWRVTVESTSEGRIRPEHVRAIAHVARQSSFVYFVRSGNLIKIGVARNVRKRLDGLQCGNPELLSLLALQPGDQNLERRLHKQFAADRVRGEWFNFSPAIKSYIEGLQ